MSGKFDHDDLLHPVDPAVRSWSEEWWIGLSDPEQHLSCLVCIKALPNMKMSLTRAWVWDDTAAQERRFLYAHSEDYLPPLSLDFQEIAIDQRLRLRSIEPDQRYTLMYDDPGRLHLEAELTGVAPPWRAASKSSGGRLHQPMWATGSIRLPGRTVSLIGPATRSRRWGPSQTASNAVTTFSHGTSQQESFQLFTASFGKRPAKFLDGFVHRHGVTRRLVGGTRTVLSLQDGYPMDLRLDVVDSTGRQMVMQGDTANVAELEPWPNLDATVSLTLWSLMDTGTEIWGNDSEISPRPQPASHAQAQTQE